MAKTAKEERANRRKAWEEWQEDAAKNKQKQMYSWIRGAEERQDMMIKQGESWTFDENKVVEEAAVQWGTLWKAKKQDPGKWEPEKRIENMRRLKGKDMFEVAKKVNKATAG